MDQITDSQELVRRFNEDEAVWQRYECRRRKRLRLSIESPLLNEALDEMDWIEATREVRQVRCIGRAISEFGFEEQRAKG
jgi:hypothetical protein